MDWNKLFMDSEMLLYKKWNSSCEKHWKLKYMNDSTSIINIWQEVLEPLLPALWRK